MNQDLITLPNINNNQDQDLKLVEQLKTLVRQTYVKMLADKKQTPNLVIPRQIPAFIVTRLFFDFLISMHSYLQCFRKTMNKYQDLRKQNSTRVHAMPKNLTDHDKKRILELEKQISVNYSTILLKYSHRSATNDQFFFETFIYMVCKIMRGCFDKQEADIIEQEINRLFRTDKYNLTKKRHQKDQILNEYPILKQHSHKSRINVLNIISTAHEKYKAHLQIEKKQKQKSIFTHRKLPTEQMEDLDVRSPVLSTWLPSNKHKLYEASKYRILNETTMPRKSQISATLKQQLEDLRN